MKIVICSLLLFISSIMGNPESRRNGMVFKDFTIGTVILKNGAHIKANLNYDSFEEQMIFKEDGKIMALANVETVDRVEISDKIFIWFQNDIFLEKIDTAGITLYKRNRYQLRSKGKETSFGGVSQASNVSTVEKLARGYDMQSSNLEQKEIFDLDPNHLFYLKDGNTYKNLAFSKQLSKIYKVDKKLVEAFVDKEAIDLLKVDDLVRLIQYCKENSNNK
ncbi:hypothetical protein ACUNWD_19885 [Sunxiuqinia sp. A32]|uniref:hypothetical protein n=1 Tax=Sunxiuqinia sp. A32 TaxID=3461496 RepID=UPI004045C73B